ncbi:MAG: cyclodeaminase/cyclohydrolase family protein [Planctomycetota bacterium]
MKLDDLTLRELLASIGDRTGVPGGGAVASVTAALAAALARMVVAFSQGKKALAEYDSLHRSTLLELELLREKTLELAEADARAFTCLSALWKLPEQDEQRRREWDAAVDAAIAAPQQVLQSCLDILHLLDRLRGKTNTLLDSDLAIAAILAAAAAHAAAWNIRINLPQVADRARASAIESRAGADLAEADGLASAIERHGATSS